VACILAKRVAIIGAGVEQIYAYQLAKAHGYDVVGTDINKDAPALAYADYSAIASTRDYEGTLSAISAIHNEHPINAIMTVANDVPYTVAYVANALGLPGISLKTARLGSNKLKMKEAFIEAGVTVPRFKLIQSVNDLHQCFIDWQTRLIIKPTDNRGARGVLLIDKTTDLQWAYNYAKQHSKLGEVIVEEFIEGPQISTEGFVVNGTCYTVAMSDRNYDQLSTYQPYVIENGGTMPTCLDGHCQTAICEELQKAADALGLTNGPIKGDIVLDHVGNVYIIEIATRLSGGYFCTDQIPLATGVDLVYQTMKFSLGQSLSISDLIPKQCNYVAIRYWFPCRGRLTSIPNLDTILSEPDVHKAQIHYSVGHQFDTVEKHPDRLGFIIVSDSDSYKNAQERADQIIQQYNNQFVFE
jgi:biotin carboxylase